MIKAFERKNMRKYSCPDQKIIIYDLMAPVMYYKLGQFIFTCQRKMRWGVMTRIVDDTNFSLHVEVHSQTWCLEPYKGNISKQSLILLNINSKGSKKTNMKKGHRFMHVIVRSEVA